LEKGVARGTASTVAKNNHSYDVFWAMPEPSICSLRGGQSSSEKRISPTSPGRLHFSDKREVSVKEEKKIIKFPKGV